MNGRIDAMLHTLPLTAGSVFPNMYIFNLQIKGGQRTPCSIAPARSGLGTSSSFTVGLLNALYALNSWMVSKRDLGRQVIRIEQEVLTEDVGCQD